MNGKFKREKLVLKFTTCPILDCEKEEDLMKRRYEYSLFIPPSIQTNIVKENVEKSINEGPNRIGSADNESFVTKVDVSDPWSEIKKKI